MVIAGFGTSNATNRAAHEIDLSVFDCRLCPLRDLCRRNVPTARESPLIAATGVSVMRDAKHSQWWDFLEGIAVIGSAMLGAVVLYLATGLLSIHLA